MRLNRLIRRFLLYTLAAFCIFSMCRFARAIEQPVPDPAAPITLPQDCFADSTPNKGLRYLQDNDFRTFYPQNSQKSEVELRVDFTGLLELPESLVLHWLQEPGAYSVSFETETITRRDMPGGYLCAYFPIPAGTHTAKIHFDGADAIAELAFYAKGTTPDGYKQAWRPTFSDCDLMLIVAHPDDEHIFFGGIIPDYAAQRGYKVTVVYLTGRANNIYGRQRESEALAGLWSNGLRNYPIFARFNSKLSGSIEVAKQENNWEKIRETLVGYMRRYRPEVVVTHDRKGEYGHGQHKLLAWLLPMVVEYAQEARRYPNSAEEFGVHTVSKLYRHLDDAQPIRLDWRRPLFVFNGRTAFEMAQIGYSYHLSQHESVYMVDDSGPWSCAEFGLAYSTVGEDRDCNDFFENLNLRPPRRRNPFQYRFSTLPL